MKTPQSYTTQLHNANVSMCYQPNDCLQFGSTFSGDRDVRKFAEIWTTEQKLIGRERNNDAGKKNVEGDTFPAVTEMEREEGTMAMMLPDIIVTDASADCAVPTEH